MKELPEVPDEEDQAQQRALARRRALETMLRRYYSDILWEPLPAEFQDLLKKIDASKRKRGRRPH